MLLRLLFLLLVLLCGRLARSQAQPVPSYYSVLHSFISNYDPEPDRHASFGFAKKPDGWYVRALESEDLSAWPAREYSAEYLYWSKARGSYLPLTSFSTALAEPGQKAKYWRQVLMPWYDMNRNLYYGYNGWDVDVIRALEGKEDINDTLRESLARAYSSYSHRYLWYQMGGTPLAADPLQQIRDPLAPVPEAAADTAAAYIRKATEQYRILAAHNPWYPTMVGAASLKLNNELIFGWNAMMLAGFPDKAAPFLRDVHLDSTQVRMAKKLLDECPANTILITYGDNDTYQPWYVQEALNYRRDVSVVNISMLGVPVYMEWLKKKGSPRLSLTRETYGRKDFHYALISGSDDADDPKQRVVKSIPRLLAEIALNPPAPSLNSVPFVADSLFIPVAAGAPLWKSWSVRPARAISPPLKRYYINSDLLLMDIVSSNISTRPIYFTTQEDGLFLPYQLDYGMVYQLIPGTRHPATDALSLARMEKLAAHGRDFIPAHKGANNQVTGNLNRLLNVHLALAGYYYKEKGNPLKKAQHLDAAIKLVQDNIESAGSGALYAGCYSLLYDHQPALAQRLIEDYLRRFVANSQEYKDALVAPEEDDGEQYYAAARQAYEARKLSTAPLEEIWRRRVLKD